MTPGSACGGGGSDNDSEASSDAAAATQQHLARKRRRAAKRSIVSSSPLRSGLVPLRVRNSRSGDHRGRSGDDSEALALLRECQSLYSRLPKASRYAHHKLRVLEAAMTLLRRSSADRSAAEAAELSRMLCELGIGSGDGGGAATDAATDCGRGTMQEQ